MKSARYRCEEAAFRIGVGEERIIHFIEEEWIIPSNSEHRELDEEDIARCKLIHELQEDLGVNEEAVPIILRLIDQVHFMEKEIQKFRNQKNAS